MKIPQLKSNMLLINALFVVSAALPLSLGAQTGPTRQQMAYTQTGDNVFSRPSNARLNDIPIQAYRHFAKHYQQARETAWSRVSTGYQVRFQQNGVVSQAYYNENGSFRHAIRYLEPAQVDADLVKRLRKAFPGYQLDIVSEINNESRIVFLITMKNQYTMKSVLLREGEFQLIDDLDYAGL
jgi:hypothetical protein